MTARTPLGALLAAAAGTLAAAAAGAILLAELVRGCARSAPAAAGIQADYGPPALPRPEPYGAPLIRPAHAPLPGHPAPFSGPQRYFLDLPEIVTEAERHALEDRGSADRPAGVVRSARAPGGVQ